MICFKSSFSVLPRLLRHKPPPRPRWCYFRNLGDRPALRPLPPPHRRYQYIGNRGEPRQLSKDKAKVLLVVLLTGDVVATVSYGTVEAVPFTNRAHFIIVTPSYERKLGESRFASFKKELASRTLPPDDPRSIRVRIIAEEIVQALHRCLAGGHCHHSSSDDGEDLITTDLDIKRRDERGDASLNRAKERISDLLEGWEVIVVRDWTINAMYLPGGKIIVFTGLLDKFTEDAEIATVLGHEVAHAIARHAAEKLTRNLWIVIMQIFIALILDMTTEDLELLSDFLITMPFSRRMEMEADHVGLMLLAAAGYDPRLAPGVYKKIGKLTIDSVLLNYIGSHPSSKKRYQNISQERVMNKALKLYREFSTGQGQGTEERLPVDSVT